jgi:hypothetical protein
MKVKKSYTLDPEVVEGVKEIAKVENRAESQAVNNILKKAIEVHPELKKKK